MTLRRKPKRAPGENPVLRRHFVHELLAADDAGELLPFLDGLAGHPAFIDVSLADLLSSGPRNTSPLTNLGRQFFRSWLYEHGIDPDTGKMTLEGLVFFEQLVNDQNARNQATRDRRRRAA